MRRNGAHHVQDTRRNMLEGISGHHKISSMPRHCGKRKTSHATHSTKSSNASTNGLTLYIYSHFCHMFKRFQSLFGYFISETCCGRPQSFCTSIKLSGPRLYAGNIGEVETPPESAALFSHSGRALQCSVNPRLQLTLLSRDKQKHASWKLWDESKIKMWCRAVVSGHTKASVVCKRRCSSFPIDLQIFQ